MTDKELKDICLCGETTRVQFKREFTTQKEIAKEMIAFANSRGGIILFGVEDKTGELVGLSYEQLQQTSRELGNTAQEQVRPTIYIETEVVKAEEKHFLVCSIAEGRNKPYKNLQGEIWVKQGADKRRITENTEILSLFQSTGMYRPEEDATRGTSMNDLEITYLKEYFRTVYNREMEDFGQPVESMLRSLGIIAESGEVTRAGMLYFGKNPALHERSFMVKAVAFDGNTIGDTAYIDSRDISGTIPWMFRESMTFLKSVLRHQQQGQNFNKVGILEIPEVVLEELLQNAFVHIDLLHAAAIRLLVFNDRIEIINPGCLYGGLQVEDIKLGVSRQRNPLMATLAGKTMIYRGLGSGIIRVIKEGMQVDFVNEESANQFRTIVWRTTQKGGGEFLKEGEEFLKGGENTTQKDESTIQKSESTIQKSGKEFLKEGEEFRKEDESTIQKNENTTQKDESTIQKSQSTIQKDLTTTQKAVLEYFKEHPMANRDEAIRDIENMTEGGIKFIIGRLQQLGLLKREGGRKHGHWVVTDKDN